MSKISELSDGGSLQSTDYLIAVRSGGNVKVQADGNLSLGAVTLTGLTVDTNTLHVDATNNRVGLGTTTPSYQLQLTSGSAVDIETGVSNSAGLSRFGTRSSGNSFAGAFTAGKSLELWSANNLNATLDASGNLGLGVTPSAWGSGNKALQLPNYGTICFENNGGSITGNAYYNAGWKYQNTNYAAKYDIQQASGAHIWYTAPSGTAGNTISFTQAMTLDTSGNLLVGHTTLNGTSGVDIGASGYIRASRASDDVAIFNRESTDGTVVVFSKDGTTVGSIGTETSNSDLYIGNGDTAIMFHDGVDAIFPHNASTNASRDAAIDIGYSSYRFKDLYLSGDSKIGTTVVPAISNTVGSYIYGSGQAQFFANASEALILNRIGGSGALAQFRQASNTVGSITVTASATAYNTSSDYRLKENVVSMDNASDRVLALNPVRFNFISDPDKTVDGFLAHEAQAVVPEAVHGVKDELDDEGNPVYQGIDQSKLVPLLTKALQEALTEIADLKGRVSALETNQ